MQGSPFFLIPEMWHLRDANQSMAFLSFLVDFSSVQLYKGGEECLKTRVSSCLESTHNPEGYDAREIAFCFTNEHLVQAQFFNT